MKPCLVFCAAIFLSCGARWAKGGETNAPTKNKPNVTSGLDARVEAIPGINVNNVSGRQDTLSVQADSLVFAIYFGSSACRDARYVFEKRADSLLILQHTGVCKRHEQAYGVRGVIRRLTQGRYHFILSTNPESVSAGMVFQKEVVIH